MRFKLQFVILRISGFVISLCCRLIICEKAWCTLWPAVPCYDRGRHTAWYNTLQCDGWRLGLAVRILSCSLDHSRGELTELSVGMLFIINCQTNVGKRDYSLFCILCCFVVSNEDLWLPHNGIINCMAKAIRTPIEAKNLVSAKTWKWAIPRYCVCVCMYHLIFVKRTQPKQ